MVATRASGRPSSSPARQRPRVAAKPPAKVKQPSTAPAEAPKQPSLVLFAGHTPDEAWIFFVQSTWMYVPILLVTVPDLMCWQVRNSALAVWVSPVNAVASWVHWHDYKAHGPRQMFDVLAAGIYVGLATFEACLRWGTGVYSPEEENTLLALTCAMLGFCYLDVFHEVHSRQLGLPQTTHVTGTVLHTLLRLSGSLMSYLMCGAPRDSRAPPAGALWAQPPYVAQLPLFVSVCVAWAAEFALCAALARRWRLDARLPTLAQRLLGVGAAALGIACCFRGV